MRMANRDALWIDDTGKTISVILDEDGNRVDIPEAEPVAEPFGGKGDHDDNGKAGGAKPVGRKKR